MEPHFLTQLSDDYFKIADDELKCDKCNNKFIDLYELVYHIHSQICTQNVSNQCVLCEENFENYSQLLEHLCEVHKDQYFQNEVVNESAQNDYDNTKSNFTCQFCSRTFSWKSNLLAHLRRHERTLKCQYCERTFDFEDKLKKHELSHKVVYDCVFCLKQFNKIELLEKHIAFECSKKDKIFSESKEVQNEDKEEDTKTYTCKICFKTFMQSNYFRKHMYTHVKVNSFKCDECGKFFKNNPLLKSHKFRLHSGIKPYKCDYCSKDFNDLSNMKRHVNICRTKNN